MNEVAKQRYGIQLKGSPKTISIKSINLCPSAPVPHRSRIISDDEAKRGWQLMSVSFAKAMKLDDSKFKQWFDLQIFSRRPPPGILTRYQSLPQVWSSDSFDISRNSCDKQSYPIAGLG